MDSDNVRHETAEEMAAELFAAAPEASVAAHVLGVVPFDQRAPADYWQLFERYMCVLDHALDRRLYKDGTRSVSGELRAIAARLGAMRAGAREVADLHSRALRQKARLSSGAKAQAYATEGRLVAFELMGHLLSFYRSRAHTAPEGEDG